MNKEKLIALASKPARYLGGEAGSVLKDPDQVKLNLALAFPEVYEIGMSHLGLKILYAQMAQRPDVAAERIFMPWVDLMERLEDDGIPPWSLETGRPLGEFDVIGFSLLYELTYTNALHMLRLAGIPLRREDRNGNHPVIIAGGPCTVNPEPMADFMDLMVVGEAEDLLDDLMDLLIQAKQEAWDRQTIYKRAAHIEGVYAPALYQPLYEAGRLKGMEVQEPAPAGVKRRLVADMGMHEPPANQVSPVVTPVHDRLAVEIARGCTRGCRFCQAGFIYRPVRERLPQAVMDSALKGMAASGMDELGLLSLSSGDYTCIEALTEALMDVLEPRRWSLSLPSLRVDSLSEELAAQVGRVRKGGFTVAPEAGSMRLRNLINKDLSREQILAMAGRVFTLGWNHIKLYFMVGLPGETDEDLQEIGRLSGLVADQSFQTTGRRGKKPVVHTSLGVFVPKPHTPFQWEAQLGLDEAKERLQKARGSLKHRLTKAKWNSPHQSILEGVLSRGDRRLARALELAVEKGCCYDGWSDQLDFSAWLQALEEAGLSADEYLRAREREETLPWGHIDIGLDPGYLWAEREKAFSGEVTADCRGGDCQGCGVCDFETTEPRLYQTAPTPPPAPEPYAGEVITYVFRLEKTGPARFLGHLEMISQITRAFQRAGVDLAYSQGFHPHPLVKTNSALPLGVESLVERLLVKINGQLDPDELAREVNRALPAGLLLADGRVAQTKVSLNEPDEVTYMINGAGTLYQQSIDDFNDAPSASFLRVTPKGERSVDLKANIKSLAITESGLKVVVSRHGGRPKPAEILSGVFGLTGEEAVGARALKIHAA